MGQQVGFALADLVRRTAGEMLGACGLAPVETPSREVIRMPGAALRAYQPPGPAEGPVLLIIPAPFKRHYVWDLLPAVSVIRAGLGQGVRMFLLEWLTPTAEDGDLGLADYAVRLPSMAVEAIARETRARSVDLAGHSLGGTFAAIFAAVHPDLVGRLVLVDTPLAFGRHGGPLADAVARAPDGECILRLLGSPVAGSAINLLSGSAVPEGLVWPRWADLLACLGSPVALDVHLRVERWSLDEFPLPAQLFEDIIEDLYRNDRFLNGTLAIGGERAAIDRLRAPTLGVLNPAGRVVPPSSLAEGLRHAPLCSYQLMQYEPEPGPMLQHLGPLVGRSAHRRLWPEIMTWLHTEH